MCARRSIRKRDNTTAVLRSLAQNGSNSDDHFVGADLGFKPISVGFVASPPRNVLSQIYWVRQNTNSAFATSASALVESNLSFTNTLDLLQAANYNAVFDQYYLHSVMVTLSNGSGAASAVLPEIFTAIDFDNISNLGSITAITAFETCNTAILAAGKSVTRLIKPCISTNTGTNTAIVTRQWVNTTYTNVQFNGLRIIAAQTSVPTTIDVSISCLWAFRNVI
jgi:hypothetical protein